MIRSWWQRSLLTGLLAGLTLCGSHVNATTTLTVSSWAPAGHLVREGLAAWCAELALRARGQLRCDLLDQAPVPIYETLDAVERAAVDISIGIHGLDPMRFVLTRLAELPLASISAEQNSVAFYRTWKRHLKRFEEHGKLHVLAVFTQSSGQLYTSALPINSLVDLKGLHVRGGGGVARQVLGAMTPLGVSATRVPMQASIHAVADHMLDGMLATSDNVLRYGLQQTMGYQWGLPGGLFRHSFSLVINQQVWARLTRAQRRVISEVSGESAARIFGRASDRVEQSLQQRLHANGLVVTEPTGQQVVQLRRKLRAVSDSWVVEARARGLGDAAAVLAEYQATLRQLAPAN